jgi:hypothetical protein
MHDRVVPRWRKASRSDGHGACVEVALFEDGTVGVRDSKNPAGPRLAPTYSAWAAFLIEAKDGRFEL